MKHKRVLLTILATMLLLPLSAQEKSLPDDALVLNSPNGKLEMKFAVVSGVPEYTLTRSGAAVLLPSRLGYKLKDGQQLDRGFNLSGSETSTFDETWQPVWGEEASIRNHYNELFVKLEQPSKESGKKPVRMNIRFRLYDDGLGFRYEFPMDNALTYFMVDEELSEFALTGTTPPGGFPATTARRNSTLRSRNCQKYVLLPLRFASMAVGRTPPPPRRVFRPPFR